VGKERGDCGQGKGRLWARKGETVGKEAWGRVLTSPALPVTQAQTLPALSGTERASGLPRDTQLQAHSVNRRMACCVQLSLCSGGTQVLRVISVLSSYGPLLFGSQQLLCAGVWGLAQLLVGPLPR
jgi:hypothetical protein